MDMIYRGIAEYDDANGERRERCVYVFEDSPDAAGKSIRAGVARTYNMDPQRVGIFEITSEYDNPEVIMGFLGEPCGRSLYHKNTLHYRSDRF